MVVSCDCRAYGSTGSTFPLLDIHEARFCRTAWVVETPIALPLSGEHEDKVTTAKMNKSNGFKGNFIGTGAIILARQNCVNSRPESVHRGSQNSKARSIWFRSALDARWSPS